MAQFDVHLLRGGSLLVNCQSNLLDQIATRFAAPLVPPDRAPLPFGRLNPLLTVDGVAYRMVTQQAAAVARSELGRPVASLLAERDAIVAALDMLVTGV